MLLNGSLMRCSPGPAKSWQAESFRGAGALLNFLYAPSGLTYQAAIAPASWEGASYQLVPSDVSQVAQAAPGQPEEQLHTFIVPQDEATFRNLQPTYIAETPQPFNLPPIVNTNYFSEQIGQFRGDELATQFSNAINWLPETTYAPPPVILRYDAQGHPVTPTPLLPTANPVGFIIQPPLALTTIEAAAHLKGTDCISVIRVRVSGVNGANEASWQHVAQVAQAIERSTGLRALVTLGSSPQPTLVYVPGVSKGQDGAPQTIAPLGWVEERWIYIGAGIVYLRQAGQTQLLLLGAVLAVCLGYLVVTLSSLASSGRREAAILSALGWRPWQPARLFLSQALLLALGGGVVGIALALLIILLIGASPPWLVVGLALPAVLLLALLSSLYPLWQLWHIRPAEVLRDAPSVAARAGNRRERWVLPLPLPLRNLLRSRGRALIALGCLFLSALLLVVLVSGILAFRQTLQGTLLGDFMLLQTALPQVVGVLAALVLTFLSVADLLLLQVRERQREIGLLLAVGWRPWQVQRLFVQEGVLLALVGALPGVLAGWGVLMVQRSVQNIVPMPLLPGAVVLLLMGVAAGAAVPALRAMGRMQVMEVLRAE